MSRLGKSSSLFCLSVVGAMVLVSGCGKGNSDVITASTSQFEVAKDDSGSKSSSGSAAGRSESSSKKQVDRSSDGSSGSTPFSISESAGSASGRSASATTPTEKRAANKTTPSATRSEPTSSQNSVAKASPTGSKSGKGGDEPPAVRTGKGSADSNAGKPPLSPNGDAREKVELDPAASQLVKQISELGTRRPAATTREEMILELKETHSQRIGLSERLFNMKVDSRARAFAARSIVESLTILEQLGEKNIRAQLRSMAQTLAKDADASISALGRRIGFGLSVDDFAAGTANAKEVLSDLEEMLKEDDQNEATFMLAMQAASTLSDKQADEEARIAFKRIVEVFRTHPNQEIAAQAIQLEQRSHREDLLANKPGAVDAMLESMEALLKGDTISEAAMAVASETETYFEVAQEFDAANKLLDLAEAAFQKHPDAETVKRAMQSIELGRRRVGLIGKEFVVEGKTHEGEALDWSTYKDKIVLVDFWATWCEPCLREIPNIRATLDKYKDKGFDVVAVSLDEKKSDVERFFNFQTLPWTSVLNYDDDAPKDTKTLGERCGVHAIPFTLMVGRDGKVVAINLRGPAIEKKLRELLGESATSNEENAKEKS